MWNYVGEVVCGIMWERWYVALCGRGGMWHYVGEVVWMQYFYRENLGERDNLCDLGLDGRIILKWILNNRGEMALIKLMWLRIVTTGGPL